jgi:hypothetical protein
MGGESLGTDGSLSHVMDVSESGVFFHGAARFSDQQKYLLVSRVSLIHIHLLLAIEHQGNCQSSFDPHLGQVHWTTFFQYLLVSQPGICPMLKEGV